MRGDMKRKILVAMVLVVAGLTAVFQQMVLASNGQSVSDKFESMNDVFVEVTIPMGISMTHSAVTGELSMGQAWGDVDNDGLLDLYMTDNDGPNGLYRNNGSNFTHYSPLAAQVALTGSLSAGAMFADYDNDGWSDLYVTGTGDNKLFRNNQGLEFIDVTAVAGVADSEWGKTAAWGDYDQDGYLDLYTVNFAPDSLFHNNRDGTFTEVSNMLDPVQIAKPGYVASFLDYDNDGDLDIYVVNDHEEGNVLWRNDGYGCGHWCFTDVSIPTNSNVQVSGMGLAIGDYDNDGDLDMYFSHAGPQVLLQNQTSQGSPIFIDVSAAAGVNFNAIGWGNVFIDYDNDGWPDLYLATMDPVPTLANRLYRNQTNGTFWDTTATSGAANTGPTLGLAYADYNQDGWLDIVIGNRDEGYHLYQNQGLVGQGNHWLSVKLVGGGPVNHDAIGGRVYVTTANAFTQLQEVKSGSSLGAGNQLALHFGLGNQSIDQIKVVWPDGVSETFTQTVPVDQMWQLEYPTAALQLSPNHTTIVSPNAAVVYTHTLVNMGNRIDTFNLSFKPKWGWPLPTVSPQSVTLLPGESATITVAVTAPHMPDMEDLTTLIATSSYGPKRRVLDRTMTASPLGLNKSTQ